MVIIDRRYPKLRHDIFKQSLKLYVSRKAMVDTAIGSLQWDDDSPVHPIFA